MKQMEIDRQERERLCKELELKEIPEAVEKRLAVLCAELPDSLPTAGDTGRRILRTCFAAAGSLAAAFVLLVGVNAVNPTLAESLPGIGSLFQTINGSKNAMGSNLGTYGDMVQKIGLTATATVQSGYGLTVEEGYSDGKYAYLTMRLHCPEETQQYESVGLNCEGESDFAFRLNGTEAEMMSSGLQKDGADLKMAMVLKLPREAKNGEALAVSVEIGTLYGIYPNYKQNRRYDEIPVGFAAQFSVSADTTHNWEKQLDAQDNGVRLHGIAVTPGLVTLDLEIPFWGREGDALLSGGPVVGYAELLAADGKVLNRNSRLNELDFVNEENAETIRGSVAFDGIPAQSKTVTLRVWNRSPDASSVLVSENGEERLLFAEFTVDLETGAAVPSETYLSEGTVKTDSKEYQNTTHHADFTGGYLVKDILTTHDMWHNSQRWCTIVELLSDDTQNRSLEVRYYRGGERIGTVRSKTEEEWNDDSFMEGNQPAYRDETGFFASFDAPQELSEGAYTKGMLFALYYPEDFESDEYGHLPDTLHFDRAELVDAATGEVLIAQLQIGDTYRPETN